MCLQQAKGRGKAAFHVECPSPPIYLRFLVGYLDPVLLAILLFLPFYRHVPVESSQAREERLL